MTPLEINKKIQDIKKIPYDTHLANGKEIPCFNWAECIEDAWGLFEEFDKIVIEKMKYADEKVEYICKLSDDNIGVYVECEEDTCCLAICKAYILFQNAKQESKKIKSDDDLLDSNDPQVRINFLNNILPNRRLKKRKGFSCV